MSLRRRVLIGFLAVAAVLVAINLVLSATFHSFLLNRLDRQLVAAGGPLVSRPFFNGDGGRFPGESPSAEDEAFTEYFIAVGDPRTGTLTRLSSALADLDRPPPRLSRNELLEHVSAAGEPIRPYTEPAEAGDGKWRLVAVESRRDGAVTVVGISLDELEATLNRIRLVQLAGTGAVLLALGLVSWWMLRLGVDPLVSMARTADDIAGGDLSRRVEQVDERTEAGRLGAALNAMLERIEEAFRAREASEARLRRFAADASHELRTPLTSIQGYAELWRAGGLRGEDELGEAMRRMEQEARRMGGLVEDLLLLARLDQRRPLECSPVRLDEIAADAVRDARAVEPERPIGLAIEPAVVRGDEMQLRQVVANLMANARLHTPPATPVRVSVKAGGGRAVLQVADEGPGIEPEVAARVFERFFRADPSRSRAAGGSGLGLAIVAAVVDAHGGSASVESEPGRGSRFLVELPLAPQPPDGDGPEGSAAAGTDHQRDPPPADHRSPSSSSAPSTF